MDQATLCDLLLAGPSGKLCAWQQALALALREASREVHDGESNAPWIAARLVKIGGGAPTKQALYKLFKLVDQDDQWFPGKHTGRKRGRKPSLTPAKRRRIAACAMALKERGEEPSVAEVVLRCPSATMNPATKQPFTPKYVRRIFTTDCYDLDPDHPWKYQTALQKVFLPPVVRAHRVAMARQMLACNHSASWWFNNVVWMDPCSSILPGSRQQYERMRRALKGNRRYMSNDAKGYSRNLRAPPTALKQRGWEGRKMNWAVVLARGKAAVIVLPADWTLDGAGMADVVHQLCGTLRRMLGSGVHLPRIIFTDRGTGMYTPAGHMVEAYGSALKKAGFRTFWGLDATPQSLDMPDLLLHETAVALLRAKLKKAQPAALPWKETTEQWTERM